MRLLAFLLVSVFALPQEPQPLQLARSQFGATSTLKSVTLTGSFTKGEEAGTFTASVFVDGTSSLALHGTTDRSESVRSVKGQLACFVTTDGKEVEIPKHNCLEPVNWILPMVSLQSTTRTKAAQLSTEGGGTTKIGVDLDLVQQRIKADPKVGLGESVLALSDDSSTPKGLTFTRYADNDMGIKVPVTVTYGDYRRIQGLLIPHQISRSIREDVLTLAVSSATVE